MSTSLNQIDPTYLRTIHDGLLSGAVHKDNASALPQGLVVMYEEALPPASNVNERRKILEFFTVWALLKKEVSAGFVVPLLEGWAEADVVEYIAQYSKWFNSATGGTYVLYHERLRAFVLQKISHGQFMACNEAIINQCRVALQVKAGDEWERYALEHFSSHLLIDGMISDDGLYLKSFSRSRDVWERQIEMSSGLNWSILSIKNLIEFYSKYDPTECQEDYHNLLQLQHRSREFIRDFNSIDVNFLNEVHINKISRINIDNEYDAQYLYVSIIVKMHRIISSNLEIANCKGLIVKLDETLGRLQSIEHGKLNFHDVFPLSYFQELLFYYSTIDLTIKNLHSGTYKLTDYEKGEYYPYNNYDEFIGSQFSFDLFPNNISPEILDAIRAIQHSVESLNLSEIESLGQLYNFIEGLDIAGLDLPNALMIIPVLFSRNFQTNKRFDFIRSEWKLDVCECYASNITSFAFLLCQAAMDVNSDSVSIQKEIDWFAMNWLSSHKYDIDVYLSFVSEHIFWQRSVTEFENWILEMLYNRTDSDLISLVDDQKYQVMVDLYWGDDKSLNENLTKVISPFQVRYYKDEAESSKLAELDGAIITVEETYGMNAKEFLQSDFGTGPYIRSLRSVNSPVSVKNIDWFQVLPKLKEADTKTLYATMHKVFTKKLCYTDLSWADLPDNAQGFYNLNWVDILR